MNLYEKTKAVSESSTVPCIFSISRRWGFKDWNIEDPLMQLLSLNEIDSIIHLVSVLLFPKNMSITKKKQVFSDEVDFLWRLEKKRGSAVCIYIVLVCIQCSDIHHGTEPGRVSLESPSYSIYGPRLGLDLTLSETKYVLNISMPQTTGLLMLLVQSKKGSRSQTLKLKPKGLEARSGTCQHTWGKCFSSSVIAL